MKPPRVEKHPDPAWRPDEQAQRELIHFAPRFWRRLFGCLFGAFALLVVLGVLQSLGTLKAGSAVGWVVFIVGFFAGPILLLWLRPRPKCSSCGQPMKRESIHIGRGGGSDQEFMVCHACQRYADTLFSTGG
jgi:hypothetical protein